MWLVYPLIDSIIVFIKNMNDLPLFRLYLRPTNIPIAAATITSTVNATA